MSSGNFGVGLAIVGAARGYRVIIVVDAKTTQAFRRACSRLTGRNWRRSAKWTPPDPCKKRASRWPPAWPKPSRAVGIHASITILITRMHTLCLPPEKLKKFFGNQLDALVVGVSTGGQMSGLARYLKPRYPRLRLVEVNVQGSVIFDPAPAPYKMTGIGLSFRPPNLDYEAIDQAYVVPENLAYSMCHALAQREGLLLGSSTGAIVSAGLHLARQLPPGSRIAIIESRPR